MEFTKEEYYFNNFNDLANFIYVPKYLDSIVIDKEDCISKNSNFNCYCFKFDYLLELYFVKFKMY